MRLVPLALAACLLAGCGYVASPLPPLANVPARIADLAAIQRGPIIIVQFTAPELTSEGVTITSTLAVDLRVGPGPNPWNEGEWVARAKATPAAGAHPGEPVHYEIPASEWVGKDIVIAARTTGPNGKESGWSNTANLTVIAPPARPTNIAWEVTSAGLRLTWQAQGDHFRVMRASGNYTQYQVVATVTQPEWTDTTVQYGAPYRYMVQTFVPQGDNREVQSDLSEPLAITPESGPPIAPTGLRAVPSPNSIELSWEGSASPDVTGYRIYRGEPGGTLERIGETGPVPSYSDRTAQHGHNFRYTVSAVSRSGKESPQSAYTDVAFP